MNISGIPIEIHKKKIKHIHLYVKPPAGDVTVSAPLSMNEEAIERFVRTRVGWIKKQIAAFDDQPRQSKRKYVSGETMYVWGKQYYLRTEFGSRNSLVLSGKNAILIVRKESTAEQRDNFVKEWYREQLKSEIALQLPKWENATGLKSSGWQIKYMTTRWGTYIPKTGKIWLNLQLAKKTPECLDYVILHELAHLVEKTHNERFILMMDKFMPMWREVKANLNGQKLDYME